MNSNSFEQQLCDQIPYIFNVAFRLSANKEEAEDIAQETYLIALEKRGQLQDAKALSSWMRKICYNVFLQKKRHAKFTHPEELISDDVIDYTPSQEEEVVVDSAVLEIQNGCFTAMAGRLTLAQRSAFVLIDMLGLTFSEAATLMELSVSALKALLHRARKNMNAFFGPHCQWVMPENSCRCASWAKFVAHREKLKEEVRKNGNPPQFDNPEFLAKSSDITMNRVLSLFHTMPSKKPDPGWYEKIVSEIKKMPL